MAKYREITKKDWLKTIIYIVVFVSIKITAALLLLPDYWYIFLIILSGLIFLIMNWHSKNFAYRCQHCKHEFEISALTNLISPHLPSASGPWKYLKCPECSKKSKAKIIKKIN